METSTDNATSTPTLAPSPYPLPPIPFPFVQNPQAECLPPLLLWALPLSSHAG